LDALQVPDTEPTDKALKYTKRGLSCDNEAQSNPATVKNAGVLLN